MDFYNYILKHLSTFPYDAIDNCFRSYFSTLDGVLCFKDTYAYGTNLCCKKDFERILCELDSEDFASHFIDNDDIYEKSLYTISKRTNAKNTFKLYLENSGYFAFYDESFYMCYPESETYKIPSTLDEWFNLSMVIPNILSSEEFKIIEKIRKVIPSNINVEIYNDCWDEHKKYLTNDIQSIE